VKSDVETLSPTRVRLSVEVPFDELKPSLDAAYKKIAQQVRVPGFRPGRVPPRIIDQRFGRAVVLEEAVNDALPQLYGDAVRANDLTAMGTPEVDVTEFSDGEELKFTAEVDVRPKIELPAYESIAVTVDDADPSDDEVDVQLQGLRDRFATLVGVDRPAEAGDYVSLDLSATVDGEPLPDAQASGLSYEVGSGTMLDGLDEAVTGRTAGESTTFTTSLVGSDYAGADAEVAVTVSSVKTKELPELDDDFAETASEFDSLEELRSDLRDRLQRVKRLEQGMQARDKVLEELLARTDVPLPDSAVEREVSFRVQAMEQQLEAASLTREVYLEQEGSTAEQLDSEIDEQAREAVKAQLVLDALAQQEQIGVTEGEMSQHIVTSAARLGISPDVFVQRVSEGGQVPALVSEVVRGKALALVLGAAKITDASGRPVDLEALRQDKNDPAEAVAPPLSARPAEPAPEPAGAEVPASDVADAESGAGETSEERPAADASR